MAAYKIVDAEQLEAGLATVGDAVRAKAGTTALLEFPAAMAAAIAAIPSGAQVVSGTFTGNGKAAKTYPITVSGLTFQPTRLVFWRSSTKTLSGFYQYDTQTNTGSYAYSGTDSDGYGMLEVVSYADSAYSYQKPVITFNSDGFTISAKGTGAISAAETYYYVAIGG